jgi:hypothetical protein
VDLTGIQDYQLTAHLHMTNKMIWMLFGIVFLSAGFSDLNWIRMDTLITTDPRNPEYDLSTLIMSDRYDTTGLARGLVKENEISGIELCDVCDTKLWAINDSGNGPYLFLLDTETAETLCTYHLPNLTNVDWEEISLGKGIYGNSTLYIGDIGNNFLNRSKLQIYVIPEPVCRSDTNKNITLKPDHIELNYIYPDGHHNAEAFFVDDDTQDIYIITKENINSGVYLFPFPQDPGKTQTLTYLGSLPFPMVVAADYYTDNRLLMIKTYDRIFLWENNENKKLSELIFDVPQYAPYYPVEMQGESLSIGSSGYYTLSEKVLGVDPVLYFYSKKE